MSMINEWFDQLFCEYVFCVAIALKEVYLKKKKSTKCAINEYINGLLKKQKIKYINGQ